MKNDFQVNAKIAMRFQASLFLSGLNVKDMCARDAALAHMLACSFRLSKKRTDFAPASSLLSVNVQSRSHPLWLRIVFPFCHFIAFV